RCVSTIGPCEPGARTVGNGGASSSLDVNGLARSGAAASAMAQASVAALTAGRPILIIVAIRT
ncbi:MAG TPA: hypothetical protein PLQ29_13645, partial [Spirochaetales bacterium]|nr:hypothetical protein [Spirochaetales bacterium]